MRAFCVLTDTANCSMRQIAQGKERVSCHRFSLELFRVKFPAINCSKMRNAFHFSTFVPSIRDMPW